MATGLERLHHNSQNLCTLRWRQGKLWVTRAVEKPDQIALPALTKSEWFRSCLVRSKASAVCVDPTLDIKAIWMWTRACCEAQKPLYLRLPRFAHLPYKSRPGSWLVKRTLDYVIAGFLLLMLSPLFVAIAVLIRGWDRGPIFSRRWRVGERGRLFQIYEFRVEPTGAIQPAGAADTESPTVQALTPLGQWLKRTHLTTLPMLFNVIKGDISLVGPRPWSIYESVNLPTSLKARLNVLPGITGTWHGFSDQDSSKVDFSHLAKRDLESIWNWSLKNDLLMLWRMVYQAATRRSKIAPSIK